MATNFEISVYQGGEILGGQQTSSADLLGQGKPVLLNLWARLCPACRLKMPDLQEVGSALGDEVLLCGLDVGPFTNLGTSEDGRALLQTLGGMAQAGFLFILALTSTILTTGGQWLVWVFPYAGVAIGGTMVLPGVYLLVTRRTLGIMAAGRVTVSPQRNLHNMFLFGISYATGSLRCTLPVFLVVVGSSLTSQGLANSFVRFVGSGLGVGTILISVTIGAALFQGMVSRWLRKAMPYVHRMIGFFLVGAGAHLLYYCVFIAGAW